jgi:hypothetical protein
MAARKAAANFDLPKPSIAGLAIALTITGAEAQQAMTPQEQQMQAAKRLGDSASRSGQYNSGSTTKADEKAYNSALKNMPDKRYDPWSGVR